MARQPSSETLLRSALRELKQMREAHGSVYRELQVYRGRCTKAEQEAAEWKARFDLLLSKLNVAEVTRG